MSLIMLPLTVCNGVWFAALGAATITYKITKFCLGTARASEIVAPIPMQHAIITPSDDIIVAFFIIWLWSVVYMLDDYHSDPLVRAQNWIVDEVDDDGYRQVRTLLKDVPIVVKETDVGWQLNIRSPNEYAHTKGNWSPEGQWIGPSNKYDPIALKQAVIEAVGEENYQKIAEIAKKSVSLKNIGTPPPPPAVKETPSEWQWDFQIPASSQMEGIYDLYLDIMMILVAVAIFVVYIMYITISSWAFSETLPEEKVYEEYVEPENPNNMDLAILTELIVYTKEEQAVDAHEETIYKKTFNAFAQFRPVAYYTHLAPVEFIWTVIPCLLLMIIAIPSFTLVLALDEDFRPWFWVKVIGSQWFWTYECSTYSTRPSRVAFESVMVSGDKLKDKSLRLLAVDKSLTIPFNKPTRFLVTANDVIHSWAVPALGIKVDACPGRINSVTVIPRRLGIFYGQCSEICGVNHAFMPIVVEVVA